MSDKRRAPAYLPQGYKEQTRVREETVDGRVVKVDTDHYDGRRDVTVRPGTLNLRARVEVVEQRTDVVAAPQPVEGRADIPEQGGGSQ